MPEAGSLWQAVRERSREALASGALRPLDATTEYVTNEALRFAVRAISRHDRKAADAAVRDDHGNPFLPYDPAMFVAELSATHVCLLNKYNVLNHHVLFVTRHFEDQQLPMTVADCESVLIGLAQINGLAFYNAGPVAGASQPHRHIQLVPLDESVDLLPLVSVIDEQLTAPATNRLPYRHRLMELPPGWLSDPEQGAAAMHRAYAELLHHLGVAGSAPLDPRHALPPYNLLAARRWMMLVPRTAGQWQGISVNALGFAGSLFVRDAAKVEVLKAGGAGTLLRRVAGPPDTG